MPELIKSIKTNLGKKRTRPRKYATGSKIWRSLRHKQLSKQPLCEHCTEQGRTTPATEVDHIDGNSWNNAESNFASLCKRCHTIKTNRENGGLGRAAYDGMGG